MQLSYNRARSYPEIALRRWVWHPHPCIYISQGPGVQTDNMFSPSAQCHEAANKAIMIFMIRFSFQDLSKSAFIPLYGALVRPHLEYGMPACLPNLVADISHLERIQRLATRLLTGMRHLPTKRDCSDWAFIPCRGDDFGMTSLPPSRYSRGFWILIRTCFPSSRSTRPKRAPVQGSPRCEPPPKERVGIFGEGFEILE